MTARYEARPVGVLDRETGEEITAASPGWGRYLEWMAEGGKADPAPDPAEPAREARAAEAMARVNGHRATLLRAGSVVVDGYPWDADEHSLVALLAAAAVAQTRPGPLPAGYTWRTATNLMVPVDHDRLYRILAAVVDYRDALARRSFELKDSTIPAAADPSAVDITRGWPT